MKQPYISIITPCYNGEYFIENAIQSIIQQPLKEMELIIVNDGSQDATEQICNNYSEKDSRIKVFTTENKGAGHARNYGISKAKGKWICFLDSDDLYLENSLNDDFQEKLSKYEKENVDIVYAGKCMTDMNLKKYIHIYKESLSDETNPIPRIEFWSCIYRKSFIEEKNIRFYEYRKQDIESAFRYLTSSKAKKIITDYSMLFYVQRENPQSNTHTWNWQTLHEVKCLVYYDLYKKHSTESTKSVLRTIFLQEMCDYYACCASDGIFDFRSLVNINGILKREIYYVNQNIALIGKRKLLKCLKNSFLVNQLKKTYVVPKKVVSKEEVKSGNGEDVYARLKVLSKFVITANNEK